MDNKLVFLKKSIIPNSKKKDIIDIEKFIESSNWKFSANDLRQKVIKFIPINSAFESWLETIEHPGTKGKYKGSIKKLFDFNEANSIECLDIHNCISIYDCMLHDSDRSESNKNACISAYTGFCDFIRIKSHGILNPEMSVHELESFNNSKGVVINLNLNLFLEALDMPYQLIAELIYLTAKFSNYRLRVSDKNKNILSLNTNQIDFDKNMISFKKDQSYHGIGLKRIFPENFMEKLKNYLKGMDKNEVFTSSLGTRLHSSQIEKAFLKASKKLNFPTIVTPTSFSWLGVISNTSASS